MSTITRKSKRIQEAEEKKMLMEKQKAQEREELIKKLKESTNAKADSRKKANASNSTNSPRVPAKKSKMSGQDSEGEKLVESRTLFVEILRTLNRLKMLTADDLVSILLAAGHVKKENRSLRNQLKALFEKAMVNKVEESGDGEGRDGDDHDADDAIRRRWWKSNLKMKET